MRTERRPASPADDAANRSDGATAAGKPTDAAPDADAAAGPDADAGPPPDPTAPLYAPDVVQRFELGFDAAALAILTSTAEADQKTWVHATFTYGATTFADVGVRRKGTSTFRALPQKAAFKVRFDKYVNGQKLLGLKEITLDNMVSDPTFLAERLAYHVFRAEGLPAPRANAAEVVVNGASYGLYANIETPNKDLLVRLFGANASTLYEVNYGSEWLPGVEDGFEVDVGLDTRPDVVALFQSVQSAQNATLLADVGTHLDTNQWLTYSATESAVGHYDGYGFGIWGSHNYFMAGDQAGVFRLLPWSTDLTFSDREAVVDANDPKPAGNGPTLLGRCKLSPACWAAYKDRTKAVLARYETLGLVNLAQTWHAQIDPYVRADTKREASIDYYESETALLYAWLAARPARIRAQLGLP